MVRASASDGVAIAMVEQNALHALMIADRAYILVDGKNARSGDGPRRCRRIARSGGFFSETTRHRTRTGCKREDIDEH